MRVLVTGGNGFIGRWTVDRLNDLGHTPIVFDRLQPGRSSWSYFGDVRDAVSVTEAVAHVDGVIHLAAVLGSAETVQNPRPAIETNINGAVNVMEACVQYDVPLAMTSVGNAWLRSCGAGTYTIVKECAADLFEMYRRYRGLRGNLVRPTNACGPGQTYHRSLGGTSSVKKIVPTLTLQALNGQPMGVYGDGEQISDIVWVGDVANVLVAALQEAGKGNCHPTAEVGPTEHLSINQIATMIGHEVSAQVGIDWSIEHLPMRPGEIKGVTIADPSTLEVYGCAAPRSPADYLPEIVRWYRVGL